MAKLIKQPLLHFIVAGILIFAGYQWSEPTVPDAENMDKVIAVDRLALLNFMQFRAQAFQPELFREQLDGMSESDLEKLVAEFVREEALYREALAMGMDQGDYIIRQRLVQKVEFLLENMVNQSLVPDDALIESWFDERRSDYQIDAVYTFTHIFFDSGERGREQARQDALSLLGSAGIGDIAFNDASQFGDRYPFLQNYVERTRDFVVNNFTESFVSELDELTPSDQAWAGPFESRYGFHLVMLRSKTDPYIPSLEAIKERVLDDWRFESVLQNRREAELQVIDAYKVRLDLQADQ